MRGATHTDKRYQLKPADTNAYTAVAADESMLMVLFVEDLLSLLATNISEV